MASSKKAKKVINQDELRRLMREKQRQTTEKKRIESPYARYNSLGHLSCVLCNVQVKSEILWQAHVLGKPHKEKVSELKGSKQSIDSHQAAKTSELKRKLSEPVDINPKKTKPDSGGGHSVSGLPTDFFEKTVKAGGSSQTSAGLRLLAGIYEENDDSEEEDEEKVEEKEKASLGHGDPSIQTSAPIQAGLPADFFDSSIPHTATVSHSGSILKADEPEKPTEKKDNTAESLPEGFFDDPVRDAKVRKVDAPKDLMDKEWEEFQKEMRMVNTKSEAIVAEDDEEGRLERQIDEIDEQIECYKRVETLRDKRDVVKGKTGIINNQQSSTVTVSVDVKEEEEDEEELLHLLSRDWRAKGALA